ncbi:hypothetical protein [Congregibacter sp.]|uniref:hypothetical protein n=1 Tax=Congregibacter sp. TaxID=2744308 RepID=UPI003F6B68C7
MSARKTFWAGATLLWLLFTFWYTNTGGALSDEEIERFVERSREGATFEARNRLRTFLEQDTGKQFIMVNLLDLAENPPSVAGAESGSDADDLLDHYMEYMYPALLARASHPIFAGRAVAPALDIAGIEGAEVWETGALMRYRSRRDLFEIAMNPVFAERHEFKLAALDKTIAFPVEGVFYYSDPRFLLALMLFSLASVLDLIFWRRPRT